jgi:DNA-binding CsgD family transcriptional regulator
MHPVTPAGVLIGRERELALLTGLLAEAARGRGRAVLVEGEPGIGKSALVQAVVVQARESGCEVIWCAGDELSQALPLQPFLDGLRVREPSANTRRNAILRLLRGEAATERTDVSALLTEQLFALVTEQCEARPTVLVVDDLHWADHASVALWGLLAKSAPKRPLLLVGTMRPVPQRNDLLALRRAAGDVVRLGLAGLTDAAVADLVAALAGGKPDSDLLRLADWAAGNPLYLTELVAALDRSSRLTVTGAGAVELAGGPAPGSLSAVIADRLGFLAGPVREALRAAALLGAEFAVFDLAIVLGRTVTDLVPVIDEAEAAGVLAGSGERMRFRHPLIWAALYDETLPPVRAAWHREAGRALAEAGVPADGVARQLLRAADTDGEAGPMDEWMLTWLARAADPLVRQAPQVAAQLLRQAVASTSAGPWRDRLAARLADALYRVGDVTGADRIASEALTHAVEPELLMDLQWIQVQSRMMEGQFTEALATLDRALASPVISARYRARLLVLAARTHSYFGEPEKAGQAADRALTSASEAGDDWAMGWALLTLALNTSVNGGLTDALSLYERALTATQTDPDLADLRLLVQVNQAITFGALDRHEEALAAAGQARDLAHQVGATLRIGQAHGALSQLLYLTGRWDDALAELGILPDDLKEPAAACCELGIAAVISFHRGDALAARRHLAAAAPYADRLGHRLIGPLTLGHSLDREHDGALPEALATLVGAGVGIEHMDAEEREDLLGDTVRLAMQVGDLAKAHAFAEQAFALAAGSEIPHRQAAARYCRGLLDQDAPRLLAAAERYDDASRPLQRAKALEAAARQFADAGDRDQARAAFTQAADVYDSLGAAGDLARLLAEFRGRGIRRGPRTSHRRARNGWDSLTPTEINVAALVAQGLSNPQIADRLMVSSRTIGTHVSSILKKLDVHSRADIARESALRGVASG